MSTTAPPIIARRALRLALHIARSPCRADIVGGCPLRASLPAGRDVARRRARLGLALVPLTRPFLRDALDRNLTLQNGRLAFHWRSNCLTSFYLTSLPLLSRPFASPIGVRFEQRVEGASVAPVAG